jgi:hypothetical protein
MMNMNTGEIKLTIFLDIVELAPTYVLINSTSFRHVMLPKDLAKLVPKSHLMTEAEWRAIGVQQSRGWVR